MPKYCDFHEAGGLLLAHSSSSFVGNGGNASAKQGLESQHLPAMHKFISLSDPAKMCTISLGHRVNSCDGSGIFHLRFIFSAFSLGLFSSLFFLCNCQGSICEFY